MEPIELAFLELDIRLTEERLQQLIRLQSWLGGEAVEAGGIGPNEVSQLLGRHLLDGGAYARTIGGAPASIVDIGSGVGLPGAVLAILFPETHVTLLDRSGRRVDLAKRMSRVVGIENISAVQADIHHYEAVHEVSVMRASLPPLEAIPVLAKTAKNVAVLGLSRRESEPQQASDLIQAATKEGWSAEIKSVKVLDPPAWLLRMSL